MKWEDDFRSALAEADAVGYRRGAVPASEPTALAALALLAGGQAAAAEPKLRWLAGIQAADGSVGINADAPMPAWPTPLAVLTWTAGNFALRAPHSTLPRRPPWAHHARLAIDWLLRSAGNKLPRREEGHDTTLVGWPWVEGTHSWIEPTALAVLALKATGHGGHPRTREGVRLLIDRLLPGGGCNYGNTVVLGQQLVPHVQPTGLALLALAGERDPSGRIERSVAYLCRVLGERTTPASLAYGLLGMAAHGAECCMAQEWLSLAAKSADRRGSTLEMALLLLAAAGPDVLAARVSYTQIGCGRNHIPAQHEV
jgi:hypothetical protein